MELVLVGFEIAELGEWLAGARGKVGVRGAAVEATLETRCLVSEFETFDRRTDTR